MDGMNLRLHDQIDKETCHIISYIALDWMNMRVDGVRNKRMTMSLVVDCISRLDDMNMRMNDLIKKIMTMS